MGVYLRVLFPELPFPSSTMGIPLTFQSRFLRSDSKPVNGHAVLTPYTETGSDIGIPHSLS